MSTNISISVIQRKLTPMKITETTVIHCLQMHSDNNMVQLPSFLYENVNTD